MGYAEDKFRWNGWLLPFYLHSTIEGYIGSNWQQHKSVRCCTDVEGCCPSSVARYRVAERSSGWSLAPVANVFLPLQLLSEPS